MRAVGDRGSPLTEIATSPTPNAYSIMNSPGLRASRIGSPTGSRYSVAESRFSTTRDARGTGRAPWRTRPSVPADRGLSHRRPGQFGQRGHFLGDVDAGGTPGDTPSAADAARTCRTGRARCPACGSATAGSATRPDWRTLPLVDEGEVELEARRPVQPAFGVLTGQVGDVLGAGAETGRAHHGAIATRQASAGDLLPVRRLS